MYQTYYGLSKNPFELTPDPAVVFMSESHQEALAVLRYGILSGKGFLVLTGNVGTGKTTLLRALTCTIANHIHWCIVSNPTLSRDEFFVLLAHQYRIPYDGNKARFLIAFGEFLRRGQEKQERVLLIIDEAHVLPIELLEEIRLLSNQDKAGQEIFSIFLVGQPELNERMLDSRLLPLRQRVGMRFHLEPFGREETFEYILYRLRHAGAKHVSLFDARAVDLIHTVSKGTPRLINIVCDQALLTGFSLGEPLIGPEIIKECVRELRFPGETDALPVGTSRRWTIQGKWWLYIGAFLLGVLILLLLLEMLPALRPYSPLSRILTEQWLEKLHTIFGFLGGNLGKGA